MTTLWVVSHAEVMQNEEGVWWAHEWSVCRASFSTQERARGFAEESARETIDQLAELNRELEITSPVWGEDKGLGIAAYHFNVRSPTETDQPVNMSWTVTETLVDPSEEDITRLGREVTLAREGGKGRAN